MICFSWGKIYFRDLTTASYQSLTVMWGLTISTETPPLFSRSRNHLTLGLRQAFLLLAIIIILRHHHLYHQCRHNFLLSLLLRYLSYFLLSFFIFPTRPPRKVLRVSNIFCFSLFSASQFSIFRLARLSPSLCFPFIFRIRTSCGLECPPPHNRCRSHPSPF